ncbi:MAG: thioredoxin domain-containing protein [Erysipelotrichaceae bacterium]
MKKILLIGCTMLILLSGCSSSYERDTQPGEIIEMTYQEALDKVKNKDTFVLVISQSACGHCKLLKDMLNVYLEDHHVIVYDALLDGTNLSLEAIQKDFPKFKGTPDIYVVKKGKLTSHAAGSMEEDEFDQWVVDHKLDELKK